MGYWTPLNAHHTHGDFFRCSKGWLADGFPCFSDGLHRRVILLCRHRKWFLQPVFFGDHWLCCKQTARKADQESSNIITHSTPAAWSCGLFSLCIAEVLIILRKLTWPTWALLSGFENKSHMQIDVESDRERDLFLGTQATAQSTTTRANHPTGTITLESSHWSLVRWRIGQVQLSTVGMKEPFIDNFSESSASN